MEHVVFFTAPGGAALFRRTPDLEAAVREVERLRNAEGVEDARVFALTAVPLAFRTYVRVEVSPPAEVSAEPAPEQPAEPPTETAGAVEPEPEPEPELAPEPAPAPAAEPEAFHPVPGMDVLPSEELVTESAGRNGRSRGMGFFSR